MRQSFGPRWTDTYGAEPPTAWEAALAPLSGEQIRLATNAILRSGKPHPPTLPEVLAYARGVDRDIPRPNVTTFLPRASRSDAEGIAGRWFVRACLAGRVRTWVNHTELRNACIRTANAWLEDHRMNDPDATEELLQQLLDAELAQRMRLDQPRQHAAVG